MTDIATGWTVNRTVVNKAAIHVVAAIDDALAQFPFPIPILGIDSDIHGESWLDRAAVVQLAA